MNILKCGIMDKLNKKLQQRNIKWLMLSTLLVLSLVSSHFIFSNNIVFFNDNPIKKNLLNNVNIYNFKIPVFDTQLKQSVINLSDYREKETSLYIMKQKGMIESSKNGLKCSLRQKDKDIYKLKCYNLGPENKGFGMYVSNTYKVLEIPKEMVNLKNKDLIQRIQYKEIFFLGYFFGFIFWLVVFFWPIVFSYGKKNEDEYILK